MTSFPGSGLPARIRASTGWRLGVLEDGLLLGAFVVTNPAVRLLTGPLSEWRVTRPEHQ